jgi:penicillin-binding protein 1B
MNDRLIKTLLLVEDKRFYRHSGIDPIGICRAFLINLKRFRFSQGASTITQQLARTLFLNNNKTIIRKLKEIVIAFFLELGYSKDEILYLYSISINMGQTNGQTIKGFYQASRFYFKKPLASLSVAECAALIAMVKGPHVYTLNSSAGVARRIAILSKMLGNRLITKEEFFEASKVEFN